MKIKPWIILAALALPMCAKSLPESNYVDIDITEGEHWTHELKVGILTLKNRPQMAFWITDTMGNFVATIYVTEKSATQAWRASPGEDRDTIRRASSLPVWAHARGVQESDGLYLPARDTPLPDAETGATPKKSFIEAKETNAIAPGVYFVYAEINHSTDFNDTYKSDLASDDPDYSGGEWGSGQPSLVYRTMIEIGGKETSSNMEVLGHGHPAGTTGEIFTDLSGLTTAADIAATITTAYHP